MRPTLPPPPLRCPTCRESVVKPIRAGFGGALLRLFSLHTFRCQICGERFRAEWHRADGARTPDRREFVRVPVQITVRVIAGAAAAETRSRDLTLRGCRLEPCAMPIAVGAVCRVHLFLPGRAIEIARARVCSTEAGTGLEFLSMTRAARIRLGLYVLTVWRSRKMAWTDASDRNRSGRATA